MEQLCTLHNVNMPGKETESWGVLYSHLIPNVGWCNGKRIKPLANAQAAVPTPVTREPLKVRNFDEEARGKIRSLFIESRIIKQGLTPLTKEEHRALTQLVEVAMTGEYQDETNTST